MRPWKVMRHIENLLLSANPLITDQAAMFESERYTEVCEALAGIRSACNMAKTLGILVCIGKNQGTGLFDSIAVWDLETDEMIVTTLKGFDIEDEKDDSVCVFATCKYGSYGSLWRTWGFHRFWYHDERKAAWSYD